MEVRAQIEFVFSLLLLSCHVLTTAHFRPVYLIELIEYITLKRLTFLVIIYNDSSRSLTELFNIKLIDSTMPSTSF